MPEGEPFLRSETRQGLGSYGAQHRRCVGSHSFVREAAFNGRRSASIGRARGALLHVVHFSCDAAVYREVFAGDEAGLRRQQEYCQRADVRWDAGTAYGMLRVVSRR